ncbi:MAG: fibronectin type III domain-containing protein, partial [Anaerolineae bacterium]|nr:fibronectin type III domain-containing protein [Anaerolineae bacterium]
TDGSPDAYTLSWLPVTGAQNYVLQESVNVSFTAPITRYAGNDLYHAITGQPGGEWSYRIRAVNSVGPGGWSNIRSFVVPVSTLLAPDLLAIDNTDGDGIFTVEWTAVPTATLYTLEVSDSRYFHTATVAYTGSMLVYTTTDQPSGTWYYRVRGHDLHQSSPWSLTQSVVVTAEIYIPLVLRQYVAPLAPIYLANGHFESGNTDWVEYSLQGYPVIVDQDYPGMVTPHSSKWAVWMGGVDGVVEVAYIQQTLTIPDTQPYLSWWHWISSDEPDCGDDHVQIIVNADVYNTDDLCVIRNTGGWVETSLAMHAYAGSLVTLTIRARTDSVDISNYYIDDIHFSSAPAVVSASRMTAPATTELKVTKSLSGE